MRADAITVDSAVAAVRAWCPDVSLAAAEALVDAGITSEEKLAATSWQDVENLPGLGGKDITKLHARRAEARRRGEAPPPRRDWALPRQTFQIGMDRAERNRATRERR